MTDKAVLVAGSAGGIGSAVMAAAGCAGWRTFGVDRDSIDVTRPGGAERAIGAAIEEVGALSGIVHAVGMSGRRLGDGPITDCTDEAWNEVHRVNHTSVFQLLRAGIPVLAENGGGSIVVIGSALAASLDDDFLTVAYASAKGALVPLVRHAAYVGAPQRVRVNIAAPGLVDTPMARRALDNAAIAARLPRLARLTGRALSASDVAAAVLWLLDDASAALTGAVLPVDGGWTLR